MAADPNARCPRCGGAFHCGAHDSAPCACTTLRLSAALLAQLRQRHPGCLCMACLSELASAEAAPGAARLRDNGQPTRE